MSLNYPWPNKKRALRELFIKIIEPSYGVSSFLEANKSVYNSMLKLPNYSDLTAEELLIYEGQDAVAKLIKSLENYLDLYSLKERFGNLSETLRFSKTWLSTESLDWVSSYVNKKLDYSDYLAIWKASSTSDYLSIETAKSELETVCEGFDLSKPEESKDPLDEGARVLKALGRVKFNFQA